MRIILLFQFLFIGCFANCIAQPKENAAHRVIVVDTAFFMPQLQRTRAIHVLLPKQYDQLKDKRFPVLYLQDGQNMYDASRSYAGEWAADEAMDSISGLGIGNLILVFVDHGNQNRLSEYLTANHEKYGKAEGDLYLQFLVETLKPYIDQHFRTLTSANATAIAGSSLGGLISFYAAWKYPKVFGFAGIFSPSFWIAPQTKDWAAQQRKHPDTHLYFYAGGAESESMVSDMLGVVQTVSKKVKQPIQIKISGEAQHNEKAWKEAFPDFLNWFIQSHKSALQSK